MATRAPDPAKWNPLAGPKPIPPAPTTKCQSCSRTVNELSTRVAGDRRRLCWACLDGVAVVPS